MEALEDAEYLLMVFGGDTNSVIAYGKAPLTILFEVGNASMGPRSTDRGNLVHRAHGVVAGELQWGRVQLIAETGPLSCS
jgi:hypothetical protein